MTPARKPCKYEANGYCHNYLRIFELRPAYKVKASLAKEACRKDIVKCDETECIFRRT